MGAPNPTENLSTRTPTACATRKCPSSCTTISNPSIGITATSESMNAISAGPRSGPRPSRATHWPRRAPRRPRPRPLRGSRRAVRPVRRDGPRALRRSGARCRGRRSGVREGFDRDLVRRVQDRRGGLARRRRDRRDRDRGSAPGPAPRSRAGRARTRSRRGTSSSTRSGWASATAIGTRMSGSPSWASTDRSQYSTSEWTIDCGWTTPSITFAVPRASSAPRHHHRSLVHERGSGTPSRQSPSTSSGGRRSSSTARPRSSRSARSERSSRALVGRVVRPRAPTPGESAVIPHIVAFAMIAPRGPRLAPDTLRHLHAASLVARPIAVPARIAARTGWSPIAPTSPTTTRSAGSSRPDRVRRRRRRSPRWDRAPRGSRPGVALVGNRDHAGRELARLLDQPLDPATGRDRHDLEAVRMTRDGNQGLLADAPGAAEDREALSPGSAQGAPPSSVSPSRTCSLVSPNRRSRRW